MAVSNPKSEQATSNSNGRASASDMKNGKASPVMHQRGKELQKYGTLRMIPIGLPDKVRMAHVDALNQILADTITLRDLYQKHHWQVAGPTFYQLHLLFEKHYNELNEIVDQLAERIQTLGGISLAMAADVAEMTTVPRPPRGAEPPPVQISRLLEAHEIVIKQTREAAKAGRRERRRRHQRPAGQRGAADQRAPGVVRVRAPGGHGPRARRLADE